MQNDENGFKKMSETADRAGGSTNAAPGGRGKRAVHMSESSVSEIQAMLITEVQTRPLRTLALAAAVGVIVGVISAR